MQVAAVEQSIISGLLPIDSLDDAAGLGLLRFMHPAYRPVTSAGAIDSEGDIAQNSNDARDFLNVDGTDITVGVISDSFNLSGDGDAATDVQTGDLPGLAIDPLIESFFAGTDEGRAMMQIVHDVAPGAALSFAHADSEAEMAQNIRNLAFGNLAAGGTNGADVLVDDVTFLEEPFFQDGIVAQAATRVVDAGIPYFAAAGAVETNGVFASLFSSFSLLSLFSVLPSFFSALLFVFL